MQINIGDGDMRQAPGAEPIKVKVIEVRTVDGVTVMIPIPADQAKQIGDALSMTESGIIQAPANGMPPPPGPKQ